MSTRRGAGRQARLLKLGIFCLMCGLLAPLVAQAQSKLGYYRRDADEANRQRMATQFRNDAARSEQRLNELRQRNSTATSNSAGSTSGSTRQGGAAVSPLSGFNGGGGDSGPAAIESSVTTTVRVRETEGETAARILAEARSGRPEAMWNAGRLLYTGGYGGVARNDAQALAWFRKAAEAGHAGAATAVGEALLFGHGVPAQPAEALRWLRVGAEGGEPRAQLQWGVALLKGEGGIATDTAAGRRWLDAAVQGGERHAQWLAGSERRQGGLWPKDPAEARRLLALAAAQQQAQALAELAEMHVAGEGGPRDLAEGRRLFAAAAGLDEPGAMTNAALMAFRGEGGPADPAQATAWLRAAAGRLNHADAQYALGARLFEGAGLPQNKAEAATWLARAAAQQQRDALGLYGAMLTWGETVPQDTARGVALLRAGAQAGAVLAAAYLGDVLFNERGPVPQDLPEAARWNRVAAEAGRWGGMLRYGLALKHGLGVPQNRREGYRWLREAADRGMAAAREHLDPADAR
jgi:TPR repeat protein